MADAKPAAHSEESMTTGHTEERHDFQAEVARLLHMMVHSVYSEREVFLRELISNAADALDRRRYEALSDASLLGEAPLGVAIRVDPDERTLTISDTGIGMTRQEMIDHLGTIARSGTRAFAASLKEQATEKAAPDLIGQFGVGFYSAFMVADRVEVTSRRAGDATDAGGEGGSSAWCWQSDGLGAFTIAPADMDAAGTRIVLHLKEDAGEYLEKRRLETIIHTYADHISFPVTLAVNDGEAQTVNAATAIWTRPKSDIGEDEYKSFYRHVGGLFDAPARTLHFKAEGMQEYSALLFTPEQAPHDLYDPARKSRVRLYVRKVFITEDCEALLPAYLRFLRGVVDAQDLPLNISREMLQNIPALAAMKKALTGRVLADYARMADKEPEAFTRIWNAFGPVLKEGIYEDFERRDELLKLARFKSTMSDAPISLSEYVAGMKDGQNAIYYLAADGEKARSPQLEGFRARGINVLLMTDPVDDFWLGIVLAFEDKPFQSITKADASALGDAPEADSPEDAVPAEKLDVLIAVLKTALGDRVKSVARSARLTDSPVCLVAAEGDMDLRLQRMLRAQDRLHQLSPRVLEINPKHPLIRSLAMQAGTENAAAKLTDAALLLLDQARILEGEALPDPAEFADRLNRVLMQT